jgi:hypothetical protein
MKVRYPNISVRLTGENGNAFSIVGRVRKALRKSGAPKAEIDLFIAEAFAGDYNHVLQTCMKWVNVT